MYNLGFLFIPRLASFLLMCQKLLSLLFLCATFYTGHQNHHLRDMMWSAGNNSTSYPDELCESVVDVGTAWHEEAAARAQIVEEEQLLILWHQHMRRNDQQVRPAAKSLTPLTICQHLAWFPVRKWIVKCSLSAIIFQNVFFFLTKAACEKYVDSPGAFFSFLSDLQTVFLLYLYQVIHAWHRLK